MSSFLSHEIRIAAYWSSAMSVPQILTFAETFHAQNTNTAGISIGSSAKPKPITAGGTRGTMHFTAHERKIQRSAFYCQQQQSIL